MPITAEMIINGLRAAKLPPNDIAWHVVILGMTIKFFLIRFSLFSSIKSMTAMFHMNMTI